MPKPTAEVLGVYRLQVTAQLLRQQFDLLYNYPMSAALQQQMKQHCRRQLESVVLIEVLVQNRDVHFHMCDFTQEQDGLPRDRWQAAYAEAFLTPTGKKLQVKRNGELPPDVIDFRVAFFLHFYQPAKTLRTSYGELNCPPVAAMPTRLQELVPFVAVD